MRKLEVGDCIGIFSSSSPITYLVPKRFERAKTFLEAKGFKIIEGDLTGKHDYYRSGTIKERADELKIGAEIKLDATNKKVYMLSR